MLMMVMVMVMMLTKRKVPGAHVLQERDAEVADLQRQLAEYEEPEEAAAAVPALVPAGGVREDETDEEGRKRVAVLKRQLTQQLQTG